ncbi:penicillin acylase family protein [Streptomyces sp. NPDC002536]
MLQRRHHLRAFAVGALALLTGATTLPASAASQDRADRPSGDRMSAVIRYTEYGIPHIVAKDYASLGFGQGWAQATDQVCTLADGFVTLHGDRSRHFGPDGTTDRSLSNARTNFSSDLFFRGIRNAKTVEKLLDQPAPAGPTRQSKELMRGWAAGYNAWLRQHRGDIKDPACRGADWLTPVTPVDVAMRGYAITMLSGQSGWVENFIQAGPTDAKPAPAATVRKLFDRKNSDMGSNAVVFSGSTAANGRGLLLGNPHYPWAGGRRLWQSQLTIPGELNVEGSSLLGTPMVEVGHNDRIAWSHTVAASWPVNLFQLKIAPGDLHSYLVDGKPERMTERKVTVPVRGKDGKVSAVTRSQWWTRYGPVLAGGEFHLPWNAGTAFALSDPNAAQLRFNDTSLGLSKSRSVRDVQAALRRTQGLPWVNTVAADSAGHTLYTQSQLLPRITDELAGRCSTDLGKQYYPEEGLAVLDGSRSDCVPGTDPDSVQPGTFGPSAMPTLVDAPYAENSNDSPWLTNADRPLTGYPRIFGDTSTERSARTRGAIEDMSAMAKRGGLTVDDLQKQQFANRAPSGDRAAADAAKACSALPGGSATGSDGKAVDVSAACGVLAGWDRTVKTGSKGALLFDRFWRKLTADPKATVWKVPFSASDPVATPNTLNTADPAVGRALADTVTELRASGIPLDAPLGEHQFVVRNGKHIPISGGGEEVGAWNIIGSPWNAAHGGYGDVNFGSSYIQAVGWDGSACPVARTLLTYSQSSDPTSPHYSDQTELFSAGRMVKSRFCEKDILASPQLKVVRVSER